MKTLFTLITCLFVNFSWSQTQDSIDFNNTKGIINSNAVLFEVSQHARPGYGIKTDNGAMGIFSTQFWFAGLDDNDSLHTCLTDYYSSDLKSGPIANDYNNSYYNNKYDNKIWSVTEQEIINHISNYQNNFYTVPNNILNWPANGEPLNGEAQNLAPYEDVNYNGVYDPQNGDYPKIRGQKAMYLIFNDDNSSNPNKLGLEYHFMFYQFTSNDCINNTTFINLTIYNRSNTIYHDFRVAQYDDFDIGGANDDYIGCDSNRNMIYGYNADNFDDAGTSIKYGINPPAFGVKQLNHPMNVAVFYNIGSGSTGSPITDKDYWNFMHAKWIDGTHVTYGGNGFGPGIETNYMYPGKPFLQLGWTEASVNNAPNDRRMMMSTDGGTLGSGQTVCIDYAVVYSRSGGDNLANVNTLFNVADSVQVFYDGLPYSCPAGSIVLNTSEVESNHTFSVYPNPNSGAFTINFEGKYNLKVYSINGKLMALRNNLSNQSSINLDLTTGLYIIQIEQNGKMYYNKMVVE